MEAVSLDAVMKSNYPSVIRDAAEKLSKHEYLDVGTFLKELSKADLDDLNGRSARIAVAVDSDEDFDSILLLSTMLSQAEGNSLDEPPGHRTANLMILLTLEDLHRKGVLEFHREFATLADLHLSEKIATLK